MDVRSPASGDTQDAPVTLLAQLCTESDLRRRELLDELNRTTAEEVARLLRRCGAEPMAVLEGLRTSGAEWPAPVLAALVSAARCRGASWEEIGRSLGVSRQAAHQRFAALEGELRPRLAPLLTPWHAGQGCDPTRAPDLLAARTDTSDT